GADGGGGEMLAVLGGRQAHGGNRLLFLRAAASWRAWVAAGKCFPRRGKPLASHGWTARGRDERDSPTPRHLPAAVPSERGRPDAVPRTRPRADPMARQARLSRGVDRRAPFGRIRDHLLARDLHRLRRRAHPPYPPRHRGHLAALPPPD